MSDEPEKIALVLKWTKSPDEAENDFVASSPVYEGSIGRIYLHDRTAQEDVWAWHFTAHGDGIRLPEAQQGTAPSPREAAREVENAWFAAIKGGSLDRAQAQQPKPNAYAAAKGE